MKLITGLGAAAPLIRKAKASGFVLAFVAVVVRLDDIAGAGAGAVTVVVVAVAAVVAAVAELDLVAVDVGRG